MRTIRSLATGLATLAFLAIVVVPAVAQSAAPPADPTLPVNFTGRIDFGPEVRAGTVKTVDGHTETRGSANAPTVVTMSDPRLDGQVTISFDTDEYPAPGGGSYSLGSGTWRIEPPTVPGRARTTSSNRATTPLWSPPRSSARAPTTGSRRSGSRRRTDSGWDIRGVIFPDAPPAPPIAP